MQVFPGLCPVFCAVRILCSFKAIACLIHGLNCMFKDRFVIAATVAFSCFQILPDEVICEFV